MPWTVIHKSGLKLICKLITVQSTVLRCLSIRVCDQVFIYCFYLSIFQTGISTLLSALCCVIVAVITSPVIVKTFIQPSYVYPDAMYFSIGLSVVTFLHVIACVGFSTASRSPEIVNKILSSVVPIMHSLGRLAPHCSRFY